MAHTCTMFRALAALVSVFRSRTPRFATIKENALRRYRTLRVEMTARTPIDDVREGEYESMDATEQELRRRALISRMCDEQDRPSKRSIFLQFTAGELRNPVTLASLLARVRR